MERVKKIRIGTIFNIIIGFLYIVGPYSCFKVCDQSEKVMRCAYTCRAINLFGILVVLLAGFMWIAKERESITMNALIAIVLNVFCIVVPWLVIGGCVKMSMRCNTSTFPVIYILASIGIIVNVMIVIMNNKSAR